MKPDYSSPYDYGLLRIQRNNGQGSDSFTAVGDGGIAVGELNGEGSVAVDGIARSVAVSGAARSVPVTAR